MPLLGFEFNGFWRPFKGFDQCYLLLKGYQIMSVAKGVKTALPGNGSKR